MILGKSILYAGIVLSVLVSLGALESVAGSDVPINITDPDTRNYRAALQRFATIGGVEESLASELHSDVERSLEISGLFRALDQRAFLGPIESSPLFPPVSVVCPDWSQIGADALVQGEIKRHRAEFQVQIRLLDVQRGCLRILSRKYRGTRDELARIGAKIGDSIIGAFTGKDGVADTEIAFASTRGGKKEIYVINSDGTGLRAVTHNRSINGFPNWSPDGESIVYTSYRHKNRPHVFLLTRGRKSPGRVLRGLKLNRPVYRAVFHPNGKSLAFVMGGEGNSDIFSSGIKGDSSHRLTSGASIEVSPSWSPDGEQIAFTSDRSGSPQIYVMKADGSNERRLTFNGAYNTHPAWSPDGRWIAYESRVESQFDIWLIDPLGRVNFPLIAHAGSDEYPSWSPDGRKIIFSSTRRGKADLYMVNVDGTGLRRMTEGEGDNTNPAWGPYRP